MVGLGLLGMARIGLGPAEALAPAGLALLAGALVVGVTRMLGPSTSGDSLDEIDP